MFERAWQIPKEQFITVWNQAKSLDDAVARMKELANGHVPRWAVLARAMEIRKDGGEMKQLSR